MSDDDDPRQGCQGVEGYWTAPNRFEVRGHSIVSLFPLPSLSTCPMFHIPIDINGSEVAGHVTRAVRPSCPGLNRAGTYRSEWPMGDLNQTKKKKKKRLSELLGSISLCSNSVLDWRQSACAARHPGTLGVTSFRPGLDSSREDCRCCT